MVACKCSRQKVGPPHRHRHHHRHPLLPHYRSHPHLSSQYVAYAPFQPPHTPSPAVTRTCNPLCHA
jgi:hypothetical protein